MTCRSRKDIAEAIGHVAVIASLIFVFIETRNSSLQSELNTQAPEIAACREQMSSIDEINMLSLESPSAMATMSRVWGENSPSPELLQPDRALYILFRHGDPAYFKYERGAIDEERLRSALAPLPIQSEAGREFREHATIAFTGDCRNHIDELIAGLSQ